MTKYEVLKTFVDSVSGERKVPGDKVYGTIEADDIRAKELARNGLIKLDKAAAKALGPVDDSGKTADQLVAEQRAADDARLEQYKKSGGWYHFGTGDDLVKVQGRDAALEHLNSLGAADAAGNSTSGQ